MPSRTKHPPKMKTFLFAGKINYTVLNKNEAGISNVKISRDYRVNESTIRGIIQQGEKIKHWGNDDLINLEQDRAGNNEESDDEEIETKEFSVKELEEMFIACDLLKKKYCRW